MFKVKGWSAERSGWRDAALSQRHRAWGIDVPAVDIDFLLVEYDNATPVAIIDYKHTRARAVDKGLASYIALRKLGDTAGLPVFIVVYADDLCAWSVTGLNVHGKRMVPTVRCYSSELEYVTWLYELRGRSIPDHIVTSLSA